MGLKRALYLMYNPKGSAEATKMIGGVASRGLGKLAQHSVNQSLGTVSPNVVCPHCGTSGSVRMKREKAKKGVSGGKATAAVLTGGTSLLATGLSRKGWITKAYCQNCATHWTVE